MLDKLHVNSVNIIIVDVVRKPTRDKPRLFVEIRLSDIGFIHVNFVIIIIVDVVRKNLRGASPAYIY